MYPNRVNKDVGFCVLYLRRKWCANPKYSSPKLLTEKLNKIRSRPLDRDPSFNYDVEPICH